MSKKRNSGSARSSARQAPLAGKRVLITRAREQAGKLASVLQDLGATVFEIPCIEIQPPASFAPLDHALRRMENYDWLILTSVNGVHAMFARMEKLGFGIEKLLHLNIAAIGPATRKEIELQGLPVDEMPREYVAESVVETLRQQVAGQRVLLVRAKVARDVIPLELRNAGAHVDVVEAYETVVPESSRARLQQVLNDPSQRPNVITFTSSSTARNFLSLLDSQRPAEALAGISLASIGPVTSATLREWGLPVDVQAKEYTIAGLADALVAALA